MKPTHLRAQEHTADIETQVWTSQPGLLYNIENKIVHLIQKDRYNPYYFYLLSKVKLREFSQNPQQLDVLKQASDLAQQAIDLDPTQEYGFIALAETLDMIGQTPKALHLLTSMNSAQIPPSWRYYFALARLSSQNEPFDKILALLRQAMSLRQADHDVITPYVVAVLTTHLDKSELLTAFKKWDRDFPHNQFKLALAQTLRESGQYQQAHKVYTQLYQNSPLLEAQINDAILLIQNMNKPAEGLAILDKSTTMLKSLDQEELTKIDLQKATAHLKLGDDKQAQMFFKKAIEMSSAKTALLSYTVKTYRLAKKVKSLLALLDSLKPVFEPKEILYALIAEVYSEDFKEYTTALSLYDDAILLNPNRSDFYNGKGLAYYHMKQYQNALKEFRQAVKINPNDASAMYNVACALSLLGDAQSSLKTLAEAINLDPDLRSLAQKDPDFRHIKQTSQFKTLIFDHFYTDTADKDSIEQNDHAGAH